MPSAFITTYNKPEVEQPYKVNVLIEPVQTKYICQMCHYSKAEFNKLNWDKIKKIYQCPICKYEIDPLLNQRAKKEEDMIIINDPRSSTTRPKAVMMKNFQAVTDAPISNDNENRRLANIDTEFYEMPNIDDTRPKNISESDIDEEDEDEEFDDDYEGEE